VTKQSSNKLSIPREIKTHRLMGVGGTAKGMRIAETSQKGDMTGERLFFGSALSTERREEGRKVKIRRSPFKGKNFLMNSKRDEKRTKGGSREGNCNCGTRKLAEKRQKRGGELSCRGVNAV